MTCSSPKALDPRDLGHIRGRNSITECVANENSVIEEHRFLFLAAGATLCVGLATSAASSWRVAVRESGRSPVDRYRGNTARMRAYIFPKAVSMNASEVFPGEEQSRVVPVAPADHEGPPEPSG